MNDEDACCVDEKRRHLGSVRRSVMTSLADSSVESLYHRQHCHSAHIHHTLDYKQQIQTLINRWYAAQRKSQRHKSHMSITRTYDFCAFDTGTY